MYVRKESILCSQNDISRFCLFHFSFFLHFLYLIAFSFLLSCASHWKRKNGSNLCIHFCNEFRVAMNFMLYALTHKYGEGFRVFHYLQSIMYWKCLVKNWWETDQMYSLVVIDEDCCELLICVSEIFWIFLGAVFPNWWWGQLQWYWYCG